MHHAHCCLRCWATTSILLYVWYQKQTGVIFLRRNMKRDEHDSQYSAVVWVRIRHQHESAAICYFRPAVVVCVRHAYPVYCRVLCTSHISSMYPLRSEIYATLAYQVSRIIPVPFNCIDYMQTFEPGWMSVMLWRVLDITHVHWTLALTPLVLCPREPCPGGETCLLPIMTLKFIAFLWDFRAVAGLDPPGKVYTYGSLKFT